MAKRSRLAARPGQRRPLQRPIGRPDGPTARPAGSVTVEEEARAAELEAAILAEEKAATSAREARDRRGIAAAEMPTGVAAAPSALATRASEEYAYVRRDIRRIAIVGGFLLLILAILDVLVNGMHLFTL
jgi:hypothetical protein